MRLRSGLDVESRGHDGKEEDTETVAVAGNMVEDNSSVDAEWGTPLTTSFSTVDSQQHSQSLSPLPEASTSSPPSRQDSGSLSHQQQPVEQTLRETGNQLIYVPNDQPYRAIAPAPAPASVPTTQLPRIPQTPRSLPTRPHPHPYISIGTNRPSTSSTASYTSPQTDSESLRRFSTGPTPWNPASPTTTPVSAESLKRRFSDVEGLEGMKMDMESRVLDKMGTELDLLGEGGGEEMDEGGFSWEEDKEEVGRGDGKDVGSVRGKKKVRRGPRSRYENENGNENENENEKHYDNGGSVESRGEANDKGGNDGINGS